MYLKRLKDLREDNELKQATIDYDKIRILLKYNKF